MLVSRISPAPRSTPSRAHCDRVAARSACARRPRRPRRCRPARRLASIASTTHCAPKTCASSSISSGRAIAAELIETLSAPASSTAWASATCAHAAADRERHEHVVRGPARQLDHGRALVGGRRDVEEDELVGALGVVVRGELDGVPGVADVDELRALDDATVVDVHAGDDALVVQRSVVRGPKKVSSITCRPALFGSRPFSASQKNVEPTSMWPSSKVSLIVPAGSTS